MTKDELRTYMRQKRRELTDDFKVTSSSLIMQSIIPFISQLNCVMIYLSSFNEPDTSMLLSYLIDKNIKIVVPVSNTDDNTIIPSYISNIDDLHKGAYGIYEPKTINQANIEDIDLVLVPGIVFSKSGDRIGFGKGYYDKLLENFEGLKIGVCYEFQIVDEIPSSPHDVKMNMIVTEKRVYNDF